MEKLKPQLKAPTLLVNLDIVASNIARMKNKADASSTRLQPHFKTHQSLDIAKAFAAQGVTACTVSSVKMAQYFASGGWNQIHLAMPLLAFQKDEVNHIAQNCALSCNVSRLQHLDDLMGFSVDGVYIDIDTGYGRTGIRVDDKEAISDMIQAVERSSIALKGLYCHNGASYGCNGSSDVLSNHENSLSSIRALKKSLGLSLPIMYGDTPGTSLANDFNGIDTVSAGNYAFYDLMQWQLGSCKLEDIAVCMACPIIEKNESQQTVVVHGGAVHFSKDALNSDGKKVFGKAVALNYDEWETGFNGELISISQEHGTVRLDAKSFHNAQIGDFIGILPVHSCLTADAMDGYLSTTGASLSSL